MFILNRVITLGRDKKNNNLIKKYFRNNIIKDNNIFIEFRSNIVGTQRVISIDSTQQQRIIAVYIKQRAKYIIRLTTFGKLYWRISNNWLIGNKDVKFIKDYKSQNKKEIIQKPTHPLTLPLNNKSINFVDKIFVINLTHRKDRWADCIRQFKQYNINNYVRFSAIKPNIYMLKKRDYQNMHTTMKRKASYVVGAVGCKYSHLSIIKIAKKRGYKKILILEDDFVFCDNFLVELEERLNYLYKIKWDMFYLGASRIQNTKSSGYHNLRIPIKKGVNTTHAYAMSNSIFNKAINGITNCGCEIDAYYNSIQKSQKVFVSSPSIVTQKENDYSDIIHARVNYNNLIK